jgi:ankyrin repeat protein
MAPIHHAADKADVDALTTLLASGASAQAQDDHYGHTPLHKLFTWDKKNERGEDHIACFELLLRYGADVNARSHDGSTALNYLTAGGTTGQLVEMFINAGADVRMASRATGATPLHYAAEGGDCDAVRLLIRAGAALDVVNVAGKTPLELAITAPFGYNNHRTYPILLRAGAPLPDLEHISNSNRGLPYLRKVRAAGSFANYERLHISKLTLMLTPKPDSDGGQLGVNPVVNPLRRLPTEVIRKVVAFAFHAGFY